MILGFFPPFDTGDTVHATLHCISLDFTLALRCPLSIVSNFKTPQHLTQVGHQQRDSLPRRTLRDSVLLAHPPWEVLAIAHCDALTE